MKIASDAERKYYMEKLEEIVGAIEKYDAKKKKLQDVSFPSDFVNVVHFVKGSVGESDFSWIGKW
jgi:hypothetical protein